MTLSRIIEEIRDLSSSDKLAVFHVFSDMIDTNEEKIGADYAVDHFKECKTLEDFQEAFKEAERTSFQNMKPIGLKN